MAAGFDAGGLAGVAAGGGAALPTTCTAAWPLRVPAFATMMATPGATPVTVPLLSTRATWVLFDVQVIRMVGMTLPIRSNAVARSPVRSPTLTVTEGGATCTSPTVWAATAPEIMKSGSVARVRKFMAGANVRPPERG